VPRASARRNQRPGVAWLRAARGDPVLRAPKGKDRRCNGPAHRSPRTGRCRAARLASAPGPPTRATGASPGGPRASPRTLSLSRWSSPLTGPEAHRIAQVTEPDLRHDPYALLAQADGQRIAARVDPNCPALGYATVGRRSAVAASTILGRSSFRPVGSRPKPKRADPPLPPPSGRREKPGGAPTTPTGRALRASLPSTVMVSASFDARQPLAHRCLPYGRDRRSARTATLCCWVLSHLRPRRSASSRGRSSMAAVYGDASIDEVGGEQGELEDGHHEGAAS
jgi:hypothetical protein